MNMKFHHNSRYVVNGKLIKENWYLVDEFPAYLFSSLGRVKRRSYMDNNYKWHNEHIITPVKDRKDRTFRIYNVEGIRKYIKMKDLFEGKSYKEI